MTANTRRDLEIPEVEANRIRRGIRRLRAWSEGVEGRLKPCRPWLRFVLLIVASGVFAVSISLFGWTVNTATILSGLLILGVASAVISFLAERLDDVTRDHVGGRRVPVNEEAFTLPGEYRVENVSGETSDFDTVIEFADRFYMGTMMAGRGLDPITRKQKRRQTWLRYISQAPDALSIATCRNELAALVLVFPIDNDTLSLAKEGRMHYLDIGKNQIKVE